LESEPALRAAGGWRLSIPKQKKISGNCFVRTGETRGCIIPRMEEVFPGFNIILQKVAVRLRGDVNVLRMLEPPLMMPPPPKQKKKKKSRERRKRHAACTSCRLFKIRCGAHRPCFQCVRQGQPSLCDDGPILADKWNRHRCFLRATSGPNSY